MMVQLSFVIWMGDRPDSVGSFLVYGIRGGCCRLVYSSLPPPATMLVGNRRPVLRRLKQTSISTATQGVSWSWRQCVRCSIPTKILSVMGQEAVAPLSWPPLLRSAIAIPMPCSLSWAQRIQRRARKRIIDRGSWTGLWRPRRRWGDVVSLVLYFAIDGIDVFRFAAWGKRSAHSSNIAGEHIQLTRGVAFHLAPSPSWAGLGNLPVGRCGAACRDSWCPFESMASNPMVM